MLRRLKDYFVKKQAQLTVDSLSAWHSSCRQVLEACGEALHDQTIASGDIGVILDKMDKELFALRNYTADASNAVKRSDRRLAKRVKQASENVYKMRNGTARFLIRCQGPGRLAVGEQLEEGAMQVYYQRALDEVGIMARQAQGQVDGEVSQLWQEMQAILSEAKKQILD